MTFEARDLVVRYGLHLPAALDGVSMSVPTGSFYAVLGPNGSGKSTLMRALLGGIAPEAGSVTVGGRDVAIWGRREFARTVGVVTQSEAVAFPVTVRELVEMGRYPHLGALGVLGPADDDAVWRALERCDATQLQDRDVGTLSGGEFQRVRVARALAQDPLALVLDEPTASLDVRHEMEILGLLRDSAARGMTVVLITHHLDAAARFADRMLLMDEGRVAAEGSPEEVLREETLRDVYHWPMSVRLDGETGHLRVTPLDGLAGSH
jgi:iron complex transport system ATP-binding protein